MKQKSNKNWEFETVTEHTLDILVIVDNNQIIKFVTPSVESILGYRPEECIGKNAFEDIYPEDRDKLMASHREAVLKIEPKINEYRVFHKNGDLKYFESRVMPVQNHPENIVVVSIRDITLRKKMEVELEKRKNRYQELQNRLKNYSHDLSSAMKISEIENRLIYEINSVFLHSDPKIVVFNSETLTIVEGLSFEITSLLKQLKVGKLHYDNEQILILIGEQKERAHILTMNASSIKEPTDFIWLETLVYYTIMVFENLNVIENLMSQLEIALQKNERPQWILRLLFNLSEKQRMELSSDLHDTLLQEQIALYRNLEVILQEHHFEKELDVRLNEILKGLLDTVYQIKKTCNELRPPLIIEVGLESALEDLLNYFQVSSTFKIIFTTENTENLVLNEEETIGIYRIVQELLNNALKHSQATNLQIHLFKEEDKIYIQYLDDGKGFEIEKLTPSFKSIGISGMRERVRNLKGSIEFYSEPGNGLNVRVEIPISI